MEEEEVTIQKAHEDLCEIFKWIYFNYMMNFHKPDFHVLKKSQIDFVKNLMDTIHDKYADHVESRRQHLDIIRSLLCE